MDVGWVLSYLDLKLSLFYEVDTCFSFNVHFFFFFFSLYPSYTLIARLSTHPFRYAFPLSAQFFWQKLGFIPYCLTISRIVTCRKCIHFFTLDIQCQIFNVSLKHLKRLSRFIIHMINFSLNIGAKNWSSMSKIVLCRVSKPLKLVTLSNSTNVSIGYISSSIGGSSLICIISRTSSTSSSITTQYSLLLRHRNYMFARRVWLAQLCNIFTSLGFSQAGYLMFHPFPIAMYRFRGSSPWIYLALWFVESFILAHIVLFVKTFRICDFMMKWSLVFSPKVYNFVQYSTTSCGVDRRIKSSFTSKFF